jgi:hypothetical protein
MKMKWGRFRVFATQCLFIIFAGLNLAPIHAAVLTWNPNPENESIAFYTVYIESPTGATAHRVEGATSFELTSLLPNIPYSLSVTATSIAGLESEPSAALPYIIEVESAPSILVEPSPVAAPIGTPISLSVTAIGTNLRYQWFKNGEIMIGETNSTVAIPSLSLLNQGQYYAQIFNLLGSIETLRVSVTIAFPPLIQNFSTSTNLAAGGTIELSVRTSGTQPFTYRWFRNEQPLPAATNADLVISAAGPNDSGAYRVEVKNLAGTARSGPANVLVLDPPTVAAPPIGGHFVRGALLQLSVTAAGSGPFRYQWFLNNNSISGATNSLYRISSASDAHAGAYSVEISNLIGTSVTSPAAEIHIWAPITISQQPISTTNLLIGDQLRLRVEVTGPSSLSYQWFRNSQKLDGQTSPELVLNEVGSADAGSYTVTISSLAQTVASAAAVVTIIDDPLASGSSLNMVKNTSGQLSVTIQAPPNATFDLQMTESLSTPNWRRIATVTTDATGRTEASINLTPTGSGFVRAARR